MRGTAELGQPHQGQPIPGGVVVASEVVLRELIRTALREEPHLVLGAVKVGYRLQRDQVLAVARRVARRAELGVGKAEGVEQLVDDQAAVLLNQPSYCCFVIFAISLRHIASRGGRFIDALNPREHQPRRPSRRVRGASPAGPRHAGDGCRLDQAHNGIGVESRVTVVIVDRYAAEHRAVARAFILRGVPVVEVRACVAAWALVKSERLLRGDEREEALDLVDHAVHDRDHHAAANLRDEVNLRAFAPAVLIRGIAPAGGHTVGGWIRAWQTSRVPVAHIEARAVLRRRVWVK